MKIIGIAGPPKSGKDTVANLLVEKGFLKYSFAYKLREIIYEIYNLDKSMMGDREYESCPLINGFSIKQILAHIGTEGFRYIDPNTWINCVDRYLNRKISTDSVTYKRNSSVVISDVRFPNEVDYIHNLGGILIWIEQPNIKIREFPSKLFPLKGINKLPDGRSLQHDSESHWNYSKDKADIFLKCPLNELKNTLFTNNKLMEFINYDYI